MNLLAIDGGTGSVRAVIFDPQGQVLATASREWTHLPEPGVADSMGFDTGTNFDLICQAIRQAIAAAGIAGTSIAAIATTSMREGIVLLDAAGNELWGCANVDARAGDIVRELNQDQRIQAEVYRLSGQTFAQAAQPRLLWLERNRPDLYDRATTMLMLSEWIAYRLSGEAVMEPTNGSTSAMVDLATRTGSDRLASLCAVKTGLIPRLVEPGTVIGTVLPAVAATLGLSPATKVVAGGGDAQIAALGLGLTAPGQALIVGGTFWQQVVNMAQPLVDPAMRVRINAAATMWQAEAIVFHAGTAVRWFRDTFADTEVRQARAQGTNPLDLLTAAAAQIPIGSLGIIPVFSDAMNYANWIHAAPSFLNLGLHSGARTRHAMFRSLLENAAIVARVNLEMVERFTATTAPSVVFAGGSSTSAEWTHIVADVLGRPVQVPVVAEATAQGAAACAAAGSGLFDSPSQAGLAWVTWDRIVEPAAARHRQYEDVIARWRAAYPPQLDLVRANVTSSLWRAPGT